MQKKTTSSLSFLSPPWHRLSLLKLSLSLLLSLSPLSLILERVEGERDVMGEGGMNRKKNGNLFSLSLSLL